MTARFVTLMIALLLMLSPMSARALTTTPEVEPNDSAASSTVLTLDGGRAIGSGAITLNDVDHWRINNVAANSKIWAYLDTGGTQNTGATSRDTILVLLAANELQLDYDDDGGTANGLDGTIEGTEASAIAGRTLSAGGTYYLRVLAFDPLTVVNPYRVYVVITPPGTDQTETEPNGSTANANSIVTTNTLTGVRTGTIGQAGDEDFFTAQATAGDILMMVADGDPARVGGAGTGTDIVVTLRGTNGTSVLLTCNTSEDGLFFDPPSEGCAYAVPSTGTYYVSVKHFNPAGTGPYQLMVANMTSTGGVPPGFTLDIDASAPNSKYDALTDGLLILRYLFGLTGNALTVDAIGTGAQRSSPAAVKEHLDLNRALLDVDGNGTADALTDGLLIIRYLFGLRGNALIANAVVPGAPRSTAPDVEAYIASLMP